MYPTTAAEWRALATRLRLAADRVDDVLDGSAEATEFDVWRGPAAARFREELGAWRARVWAAADDLHRAAARAAAEAEVAAAREAAAAVGAG